MENLNEVVVSIDEVVLSRREKSQRYRDQAIERVGETRLNNYGSKMILDQYNYAHDVWVRFVENGNMVHTSWQQFCEGNVKNVFDKSVYGVGYIGHGDYNVSINGKLTPQYLAWKSMMMRCYSEYFTTKNPTYKGCTVSEEWHNFQNFAAWYDENYYEVENDKMNLEKDIVLKNNKVYSPDTVVFCPSKINKLFIKRDSMRGNLPIGVSKVGKKFFAQCNDGKEKDYLGTHETIEDAFNAYKEHKESKVKQIAEDYKDKIPHSLYAAMLNYTVELTD